MNPGRYRRLSAARPAAIALLGLSGAAALDFLRKHLPAANSWTGLHHSGAVLHATLLDADAAPLDDVLLSSHADATHDVQWRLHLHGSPAVLARVDELLRDAGVMRDDQFTPWSSDDPIATAAYNLMPEMLTYAGVRWLAQQPERLAAWRAARVRPETPAAAVVSPQRVCDNRVIRDWFQTPLRVALIGPPNSGKSTLLNELLERPVSIVSATPGTTRDWVEASSEHAGFPITWLDTAGWRLTDDPIESLGVARSRQLASSADCCVLVLDATQPAPDAALGTPTLLDALVQRTWVLAWNQVDRPNALPMPDLRGARAAVGTSGVTREGLHELANAVLRAAERDAARLTEPAAFTNELVSKLRQLLLTT